LGAPAGLLLVSLLSVLVCCLVGCRKTAEERLELALELTPRPGGLADRSTGELAVGSLDELLALPKRVVFGLLTRAGEKELGSSGVAGALALQVAAP
jgi:hypothetical protein